MLNGEGITLEADGNSYELASDEVEVRQEAAEGFVVFEERGYVAALDVALNDDLISERISREVVRRIQDLRKDADFDIDDHIAVTYQATDRFAAAIERHKAYITTETLTDDLKQGQPNGDDHTETFTFERELEGEEITIGVRRLKS